MESTACGKTISQRSSFCMYCGEKATIPPPVEAPQKMRSKDEKGRALSQVYDLLLGHDYMNAISGLWKIDHERALKIMQSDLRVAMRAEPTLSEEERIRLLDEIVAPGPKHEMAKPKGRRARKK